MGLLQEAVGLVAVREVGGRNNHILYLLCQCAKHGAAGCTGGCAGFLLDRCPVDLGSSAAEPFLQLGGLVGVGFGPFGLGGLAFCHDCEQLFAAAVVEPADIGEYLEGILRVAAQVLDGVYVCIAAQRCTVGCAAVLVAAAVGLACALAHHGMANDEGGGVLYGLRLLKGAADLLNIIAVNLEYLPAPGLVFLCYILAGYILHLGRELDVVAVVEHNQVVQLQVASQTACALRNLFLDTAVGNVGIYGLVHHLLAQARCQEFGCDGCAHGKGMALSQRTGGVLNASLHAHFGVAGSGAAPLAERLKLPHLELAGKGKGRVEHR